MNTPTKTDPVSELRETADWLEQLAADLGHIPGTTRTRTRLRTVQARLFGRAVLLRVVADQVAHQEGGAS